jgi:type I restriction enzyme R subunit
LLIISFNEENYENAIIELFQDLGYEHFYGGDLDRYDYSNPIHEENLYYKLIEINEDLPKEAILEAIRKLKDFGIGSLVDKNIKFSDYLQNGVSVTYHEEGEEVSKIVKLIDYETISDNSFFVINQWTVEEHSIKRPDIVVFVNGLPLVVIELKSPSREETDASDGYRQLKNYMKEIPSLFTYNAFCVISDLATSKAGTITADEDRYMEWKSIDGSYETTKFADFNVFFKGIFEKERFLDILKHYILFSQNNKILAAYHQFFAVEKSVESTCKAMACDGKAGVFWHTQGSGKSLSMVFYVKKIQYVVDSPTFVIITDRNDLDDQLFMQFNKAMEFLRQNPVQATSRKNLIELLDKRKANGILFTTMQKFEESDDPLTERDDVIVISDEAHRSQYGLEEKVDPKTGKITVGTARKIRDNLPNASFIGFTGTPIETNDKSTIEVFGNYIDIYDITQSVEDGATRPIYYESRVVNISLDEDVLEKIDEKYYQLSTNAEDYAIERSKKELSQMEVLIGSPKIIHSLCEDIIHHYEDDRAEITSGKAMIVAYSRKIAMKIYKKILKLRPEWKDKVNLVVSSSNNDPEDWYDIIGNKTHKKELATQFKDNSDPFKIAIVVDMWLTGFDVPSLATMYVFKPMKGHGLMQAIARVNRVFGDKEGGLIVDYIGISGALRRAMSDYTKRDKKNYGDMNISKTALLRFEEKIETCRDLFHGFNYSGFIKSSGLKDDKVNLKRAKLITEGVNFLSNISREDKKNNFIKTSKELKQALSLCKSIVNEEKRFEAAYFEAVRTLLTRIKRKGKFSLKEINEQINNLLKQSIKSEGVINLFSDIQEEFSLFDPDFLDRISMIPEKNLAIDVLNKLLNEKISKYTKVNLVKSELFSELLKQTMNKYVNGLLTNEQIIEELIKIAKEIKESEKEGKELGLTSEELAFYDAITKPQIVKDKYENEELVAMTQELTEQLNKNRTIDWQKKESARAKMRVIVKKLLKKHKYPPEEIPQAIDVVIKQCEKWADNEDY